MELKRGILILSRTDVRLLIVPYGIETSISFCPKILFYYLLIVPYGIETLFYQLLSQSVLPPFNRTLWN